MATPATSTATPVMMTTEAPTLPGDWEPTVSGCQRTADFWVWFYSAPLDERTVLGGPSQITDCLAPTWSPELTYAGSQCPPNYTPVCEADAVVTCCPTLYDFDCVRTPSKAHSDQFRCSSRFAEDEAKQKIMVTDFRSHTMRQETRDVREGLHLFALAMLYTAPATATDDTLGAPTSSGDATLVPSEEDGGGGDGGGGGGGVSVGVAVGAGVGAAAGFVLICAAAWLLFRRHRRRHGVIVGEVEQQQQQKQYPPQQYPQQHYQQQQPYTQPQSYQQEPLANYAASTTAPAPAPAEAPAGNFSLPTELSGGELAELPDKGPGS